MAQNQGWKSYQQLEHCLKVYVSQNLKRVEMLDHMKRDFGDYNWSLRAIARRLKELSITCVNYETIVDDVKEAVEKKINGPGKLPG